MSEKEDLSTPEDISVKPKRCTACREPVKGHFGPTGDKCTYQSDTHAEERAHVRTSSDIGTHSDLDATLSKQSKVLDLILEQLMQLNIQGAKNTDTQWSLSAPAIGATGGATGGAIGGATGGATDGATGKPHPSQLAVSSTSDDATKKLHTTALNGEYVNLYQFIANETDTHLPEYEPSMGSDSDGNVFFKLKKSKKCIDNFNIWLTSWNKYETIVMRQRPDLHSQFVEYRQFIQNCNAKFMWPAVCSYDMQFRRKLGNAKSFMFSEVDTTLYTTTFDTTTIKANPRQCFRCRSVEHMINMCPFPAQPEEKKAKTTQSMSGSTHRNPGYQRSGSYENRNGRPGNHGNGSYDRWYFNGMEGCNLFQRDMCRYPNCKRAHVCQTCHGPEPHNRCKACAGSNKPSP